MSMLPRSEQDGNFGYLDTFGVENGWLVSGGLGWLTLV